MQEVATDDDPLDVRDQPKRPLRALFLDQASADSAGGDCLSYHAPKERVPVGAKEEKLGRDQKATANTAAEEYRLVKTFQASVLKDGSPCGVQGLTFMLSQQCAQKPSLQLLIHRSKENVLSHSTLKSDILSSVQVALKGPPYPSFQFCDSSGSGFLLYFHDGDMLLEFSLLFFLGCCLAPREAEDVLSLRLKPEADPSASASDEHKHSLSSMEIERSLWKADGTKSSIIEHIPNLTTSVIRLKLPSVSPPPSSLSRFLLSLPEGADVLLSLPAMSLASCLETDAFLSPLIQGEAECIQSEKASSLLLIFRVQVKRLKHKKSSRGASVGSVEEETSGLPSSEAKGSRESLLSRIAKMGGHQLLLPGGGLTSGHGETEKLIQQEKESGPSDATEARAAEVDPQPVAAPLPVPRRRQQAPAPDEIDAKSSNTTEQKLDEMLTILRRLEKKIDPAQGPQELGEDAFNLCPAIFSASEESSKQLQPVSVHRDLVERETRNIAPPSDTRLVVHPPPSRAVKRILNELYHVVARRFLPGESYDGQEIRDVLAKSMKECAASEDSLRHVPSRDQLEDVLLSSGVGGDVPDDLG
ncbi:unnamed protein product [Cyprideis torosa]|uniref:Uncharacterized protein n=1 Tax=Cyprideis torosa TaxID=163714 RepID=A0A7R8ZI19_9CRUS|nr:unnamed protein product [Cyprideis torosa]CAG0883785.1 unnamed protein product [Cyprideis torosa]